MASNIKCKHCRDTGSLSKCLYDSLDCAHCDTAVERTKFNEWFREALELHGPKQAAWLAYQRGMAESKPRKK
jgi:hypothetical protein